MLECKNLWRPNTYGSQLWGTHKRINTNYYKHLWKKGYFNTKTSVKKKKSIISKWQTFHWMKLTLSETYYIVLIFSCYHKPVKTSDHYWNQYYSEERMRLTKEAVQKTDVLLPTMFRNIASHTYISSFPQILPE